MLTSPQRLAVIIPARDCAALLAGCIAAVLDQTWMPEQVLISVGPSRDRTRAVAERLSAVHAQVVVVDNRNGDRGSAINRALDVLDADVAAMVDAQSRLARDYFERSLEVMMESGAAVVGGPMRAVGRTTFGRAVARALSSAFGVGNSAFHFARTAADVDSVYLGVYDARVFSVVGSYDEQLLRTEDDDFNERVRAAGYRIRLDPRIRSTYLCRDAVSDLWRQYYGYGYWKVGLAFARPRSIRIRHLIPAAFVSAVGISALTSVFAWRPAAPIAALGYVAAAIAADSKGRKDSPMSRLAFPVATATMHIGYGVGSLVALANWSKLRTRVTMPRPNEGNAGLE